MLKTQLRKGTNWPDASLTILLSEKSCPLLPEGWWTRDMQMGDSRAEKGEGSNVRKVEREEE